MRRRSVLQGLSAALGGSVLSVACQRAMQIPNAERTVSRLAYSPTQRSIAHSAADIIIPATDTPGALEAGAGEFIDFVVAEWYTPAERASFVAGLDWLQAAASERYGQPYLELTPAAQRSLLSDREQHASGTGEFFDQLRELTVVGFFTSRIGATVARHYLPMPGRYDGDYKFEDVGKQWSA